MRERWGSAWDTLLWIPSVVPPTAVGCKVQVRDQGRKVAITLGYAVGKSKKQVPDARETRMLSQAINVIGNGGNIKRNCGSKGPGEPFRSCWKKQWREREGLHPVAQGKRVK